MKNLHLLLVILLLVSANSIAQVTNLIVNGQNSNFTMASGDQLSWSYNVPSVGDTTIIEFWIDTDQNGILNPATDVMWSSFIQADGITNGGQNGIPDMDGTANGQLSLQINVGLAPSYYILVFKNHNFSQAVNGTVTALASPSYTISGNVSVPSGMSKQNIALTLQNKGNGGPGMFWNGLTDINGDFAIQMNSDTTGNPWNLKIDNSDINNSFLVSPNNYSLNINPNTTTYSGNNFSITSGGLTNLTVNGSGTNFTMVSGDQLSWSYNVPVVGDTAYIEIWIDTDQDGNLNPQSDVLWTSFPQVDGVTNSQQGLPDMDGAADGHISFQMNIGLAPLHYIMVFQNHNNRKSITGIVSALANPAFTISGNVSVPEGVSRQHIPMRIQSSSNQTKFWNAITDNNGDYAIQMNSDTSGNPWKVEVDGSSGHNSFISTPESYTLTINPNTPAYTGNNFVLTPGSNNKNITVTCPNGGEVWKPGETKIIYWNMSGMSNVKIEFSSNRGNSWSLIVDNYPSNPCFYNWTVPSLFSQDCFIRISDAANNSINDMSNNNFIIYQPTVSNQYSGMGQNTLNFGDTYILVDLNVLNPDTITSIFFMFEGPQPGILPQGITACSGFYWHLSSTGNINFNNGVIKIPVSILQNAGDPAGFTWMKRSTPGEAWTNIGNAITDGNFVSTVPFNSFSEFALGIIDNSMPVELTSFTAKQNSGIVSLAWETKTEIKNYGFDVERKTEKDKEFTKIGFIKGNGNSNTPNKYSYRNNSSLGGRVIYRLRQVNTDGNSEYSNEIEVTIIPSEYNLFQNYPNPFNPSTIIKYALPYESNVSISIYNSLGQSVREINEGTRQAGYYELSFNSLSGGSGMSSGVYFYRIKAAATNGKNEFSSVKRMLLLK